jgi:radical SAM protein with 4Fe4S-binding SPASM domain
MNFRQSLQQISAILAPQSLPLPSGLFHYLITEDGGQTRVHLRIDPVGQGTMLVNASRVFHLNPSAACMAYLALEKMETQLAVRCLRSWFSVPEASAIRDYTQFTQKLDDLLQPEGACPICDLDLDLNPPFSQQPLAPYRMDLALTYRCNNDCAHCYNARPRTFPELPPQAWFDILDHLWETTIPHIVFTGGEPTLREDLLDLIRRAEKNGQITGLNTNARRLSDERYVEQLVAAGLDHVQITLESHDPAIHDGMVGARGAWKQTVTGIRNALQSPLFVMTNTTMLRQNSPFLEETLQFLAELQVPTVGLNALIYSGRGLTAGTGLREAELPPLLEMAQSLTSTNGQRLIWYTPTQYCNFDPMQLELGVKGCTAAMYNMCVEPDGGVLPCQSYYQQVGNILDDSWESIWNHELCLSLRHRKYLQEKCSGCTLVRECGGGCPLAIPEQPGLNIQIV